MKEKSESDWRKLAERALKESRDGEHAWFKFKNDNFDTCAKCGFIRRADDKNKECPGKARIRLNEY